MKRTILLFCVVLAIAFSLSACKSEQVKEVEKKIDNIGTITLDSGSEISEIEEEYNKLSEEEKAQVENAQKLTDSKNKYSELKKKESEKRVDNVVKLIDAIGNYTPQNEKEDKDYELSKKNYEKVKKAYDAYEKLTDEEKEKVTNYSTLSKAVEYFKTLNEGLELFGASPFVFD